ncbi:hypothetical protein HPP92_012533, partial [Vanilla planifolia]
MDSSEEEDDFLTHEYITPQSCINAVYQSKTEKDIRRICTELLDLKDAVENLRGNMHSKYLGFLRISEEVIEVEQELIELQKHVSAQGILVQDLMSGVCQELAAWNECERDENTENGFQNSEIDDILNGKIDEPKATFLETLDMLLAEHKVEEILLILDAEEKNNPELKNLGESPSNEASPYMEAFQIRKEMLKDLLVSICEQPFVRVAELKKALSGLVKLGKISLAQPLLLKACGFYLQKKIDDFLPSCSSYTETYAATLSQFFFSTIFLAAKDSVSLFGDMPVNTNRIVQWAEYQIESFVRLVRENSPPSDCCSALRSVSICVDASLNHCSILETQGLKFSKLLMVLLRPQIEEVLDLNFRRARRSIVEMANNEDIQFPSLEPSSPTAVAASSSILFTSRRRFMLIVEEILGNLTPKFISYYGGNILNKFLQLFDKYVDILIKALPGTSDDDSLIEHKEPIAFRAETDAEQLVLLGNAFTISDEFLPGAVTRVLSPQTAKRDDGGGPSGSIALVAISAVEYKDWRRHLQHSFEKLRDYFCRQYVLTFIYSREGKARMDARMYLDGKADDLFWDSDPYLHYHSRLQQLASVAGDVLLGKEKLQKNLLSRLTETVVMWLSEEQEFWDVFEDEAIQIHPFGLQQLILDMHFVAEIAVCGGYSSRNIHQLVSVIITRAIGTFSERGLILK